MPDVFGRDGKRPTVGCDLVIFAEKNGELMVLLVQRGHDPFKGHWALPGGFMEWDESCEECALRELKEETALDNVKLEPLGVFSEPGRDPRGSIVSVAFWGLVDMDLVNVKAGDDAASAKWVNVTGLPKLAFDHDLILAEGINAYRGA